MKVKLSVSLFLVAYFLLVLFQIKTTNIKTAYTLTPYEIDLQIQRMNSFPPRLAKLGYILEVRKESQIFEKLQNNFFTVIDFKEYFPNRLPFILSPLLIIGLYYFVLERKRWKTIFDTFLVSIGILTILGPNAKCGPVLIMPFLGFFIIFGVTKIISWMKK